MWCQRRYLERCWRKTWMVPALLALERCFKVCWIHYLALVWLTMSEFGLVWSGLFLYCFCVLFAIQSSLELSGIKLNKRINNHCNFPPKVVKFKCIFKGSTFIKKKNNILAFSPPDNLMDAWNVFKTHSQLHYCASFMEIKQ